MLAYLKSLFATGDGIHISLKAEPITKIGPLTITNSIIYGAVVAAFMMFLMVWVTRNISVRPKKGFPAITELLVDYVINLLEGAFGSREKALKYTPIFGTFFVFILFGNLLGLLPVVGPGLTVGETPLFRPFTADINGTIALAVIAIVIVQVLSVKAQGGKGHLQHYFTNKPLNPINMFIGILEVLGEFTRMISLSLRLFLNTAVGEILIAVFTSLIAANGRTPFAVIPIFLFEALVAGIQAYVFTVLCATYLSLAIAHADHHDEGGHKTHDHEETAKKVEAVA
jgi:F-type H+-transporting ATPase subunit a